MRIDKRKPVPELMQEIDKKFIVPESKIGKYNRLVATCQNCNLNLSGDLFNHIIGFRGIYIGNVFVCKCPKCENVWHAHTDAYYMDLFLMSVENGTNVKFNKEVIK